MNDLNQLWNVLVFTLIIAGIIGITSFWLSYFVAWWESRKEKMKI
jgi:ABC-type spermidine/putrescine transport system permease subunit I